MRNNKIIAVLITVSMLITAITLPVSADDTVFTKIYASDNFAEGTDGWIVGESPAGFSAAITIVEDAGATDGKALKITFPGKGEKHEKGDKYAVYGSVTKQGIGNGTEFSTDKELTIKARVKKTESAMNFDLKGNRPNTLEQVGHDYEWEHYYRLFKQNANADGINVPTDSVQGGNIGNYGKDFFGWHDTAVAAATKVDLTGKWVEYTIKFKPAEQKYYITTTYTDTDGTERTLTENQVSYMRATKPELLKEYGDDFAFDVATRQYFGGLKSVTFTSRTAGDIYVDYVEIYGERDVVNTTATLNENYIRTTDALNLTFITEDDIHTLPEGAVYIDGVESVITYDKATKTVTLKPKAEFAPGAHHTVKVNSELLYEDSGIIYEGDTEFPFDVSDVSVNNLVANGRVISGNVITSSYVYSSSKPEGTHLYQWQMSPTGVEGTFTDIDGATSKDFTVTDDEYGKYLRFKMIPYGLDEQGNNTFYGFETYSNVIVPEKAPVIDNLKVSTSTLFSGIYISALYDYSDENGDKEGETVVRWYTSDSAENGEWTEVEVGKTYFIENTDAGKYIKCTATPVANSRFEPTGAIDESPVVGPVVDLLATTNLFEDPGFESGRWEAPWEHSTSTGWIGPDVHSKDAHTGTYSVHMPPRMADAENYGQAISFTKGKCYVFGAWAKKSNPKAQDITGMKCYTGGSGHLKGTVAEEISYTLNSRWQHMVYAFECVITGRLVSGFVTWESRKTGDAYLDDWYCGELLVGDIHTYDVEPVTVPVSGETKVKVTNGQALNQLGTNHGLENEKLVVSIPEIEGVYVDADNNIVVTDKAHSTKFVAEIYCEPKYAGATQAKFQKFVEIEIKAHNDPTPKVYDVDAIGTVTEGAVLTGSYSFYQVNNEEDASEVKWMYSDSENGVYYDIPGANSLTYTVQSQYANKYIKFVVTPKSISGFKGDEVRTVSLTKPRAPFATDVKIKGVGKIGSELIGEYTYTDPNRDAEGTSMYKWYTADDIYGPYTVIQGENSKTLTVTDSLKNKYIKFGVTPVSVLAPQIGVEVLSEAIIGAVPPQVTDVSIEKDGYRLQGTYKYYHPNGIREGTSLYSWTIDGITVSTKPYYEINFTGTHLVTFTVTPVCDSEPRNGESVSASAYITGHAETPGGGSGTGGFGGGVGGSVGGSGGAAGGLTPGAGVTNINDMKLPETEVQKPKSDIAGHWGEAYIKEMETRGVMKADAEGNFDPDRIVSRQEMITYLFDALKLEETEYSAEFSDVSSNDTYAGKLQTMIDNGTIASYHEFRPNDGISREEMCKILYVSLENAGKLTKAETNLLNVFTDKALISDWATDYVNTIFVNKIMIGTSDTTFAPKENITRAQVATMLVRILDVMEKEAE